MPRPAAHATLRAPTLRRRVERQRRAVRRELRRPPQKRRARCGDPTFRCLQCAQQRDAGVFLSKFWRIFEARPAVGSRAQVALDPRVKLWISAREPFAHVVSLYAHCQQPGAAGKRRHAFPNATLSEFIDVFYSRGGVAPAKRRGGVEMVALGRGLLGSSRRFENHRRQSSVSSNSVARAGTAPTTRGTSRRGIWVTATSRGRRASSTKRTGS